MTDNTEKLGGDALDARAYEVLEKEFQEVRRNHSTCRILEAKCDWVELAT